MKNFYLIAFMLGIALGLNAQNFSAGGPIKTTGLNKSQKTALPNLRYNGANAGRATSNAYISYFDDNYNAYDATTSLYYTPLNLRLPNTRNGTYRTVTVVFDSLIDVGLTYPSTLVAPLATSTVTVDSVTLIYMHQRTKTTVSDTFKISLFNAANASFSGTGAATTLTTVDLWSFSQIATGSNNLNSGVSVLGGAAFARTFPVNQTLPTGATFGVRVDYQGDTTNKFNLIQSFTDNCNDACLYNLTTVPASSNSYINYTTTTPTNLSGFQLLTADCNQSGTITSAACEYLYGEFWVIAHVTINTPNATTPPTVVTNPATNVAQATATLNGSVNANSLSTTTSFEWGLTTSYGNTANATPSPVTGTSATNISANLSSLQPNTTYHFRAKGVNNDGTAYGIDRTFTTLAQSGNTCTPQTGINGYSPTASGIACATNTQVYSQDVSFSVPSTVNVAPVGPVSITSLTIDSIRGLPTGLTATPNQNPATYPGGTYGCFRISGTPNAACGQYRIYVYVTLQTALGPFGGQDLSALAAQFGITGYEPLYVRLVNTGVTCPSVNTSQSTAFEPINCAGGGSVSVTINKTDATCSAKGSATANATGGSGYSYLWSPGNATTQTISNLNPGTYTVTVTATGGATATATTTISLTGSINASATATATSCGLNNGSVTVNATGATGGYTYQWGSNAGNATSQTVNNLAAGTYSVTVTSVGGCTAVSSATVNSSSSISVTVNATSTSCGFSNGSVTANPTGGSGYSYVWNPSGNSQTLNSLASGTYTVTVTATGGCTAVGSGTVNASTNISVSVTKTDANCQGLNGSATANPSGGSGYTYSWSNSGNAATINSLTPGSYTVTVTATGGCTATGSVVVGQTQSSLAATASTSVQPACNQSNGSVTVSATGGTPNYSYAWNTSPAQNTQTANNLAAGVYTVTVTDNAGCTTTSTVNLSNVGGPTASISGNNVICNGQSTQLTASGGGTYTWSNGLGSNANVTVNPTTTTTYTVTVTVNNCNAVANRTVTVNQPATTTLNQTICSGKSVLFNGQQLTTSNTYRDTLSTVAGCDSFIVLNLTVNPPLTGSYAQSICAGDFFVFNGQQLTSSGPYKDTLQTAGGCDSIVTLNLTVNPAPTPVISQNGNILSTTQSFASYEWQLNGNTIQNATSQNYTPTQNGNYTVIVTDANGCSKLSATYNFTGVGIKNIEAEIGIKVLPNPNNGSFKLTISDNNTYDVTITNIIGEKVISAEVTKEYNFALSETAKGIYFVHVSKGSIHKTIKFTLIK